jgi:hypothetical protein
MTHAVDLQQRLCLRILRLIELLDLTVVLLDLECHLCDLLDNRSNCLSQPGWHHCQASLGKGACRRRWHAMTAGFRQPTHAVHRSRTQANDKVPRTNQRECFLLLDRSVHDGPQYLWIKSGVACQLLRIHLIALPIAVRDDSRTFVTITSWPSS